MKSIYGIIILLLTGLTASAQELKIEKGSDTCKKDRKYLSIGSGGVKMGKHGDSSDKVFDIQIGMLDLGINYLQDKTDYTDPAVQHFLHVSDEMKNENLFAIREAKSINVNVYPILLKYRALKTDNQRIYLSAGLGLQMYNFRFNKPITYVNETAPMVITDTLQFSKNKVGLTYLSVPLMLTLKTKLAKDIWVVYGAGITAGYRIASWTKQVSTELGKRHNHDQFNFNNFNSCITAELGLEGYFRLYASYQVTALHENILDQHPYCIGVRFLGI